MKEYKGVFWKPQACIFVIKPCSIESNSFDCKNKIGSVKFPISWNKFWKKCICIVSQFTCKNLSEIFGNIS